MIEKINVHRLLQRPFILFGLVYITAELSLTLVAFPNMPAATVFLSFLLVCLPILLASTFPTNRGLTVTIRNHPAALLVVLSSALAAVAIRFLGNVRWKYHFINHPNGYFEQTGAFNQDSAFHVALINAIMRNGYPSTSLHLEPLVPYHALTHYFDAVILALLRVDPWDSYSLLFQAKGVAVTLAVLYFAHRVSKNLTFSQVALLFFALLIGVTSDWSVAGLHSQWLPTILLLLAGPWFVGQVMKSNIYFFDSVRLTLVIFIIAAGKISIGFPLALVVGFWMFFRSPSWGKVFLGLLWAAFFWLFGSAFERQSEGTASLSASLPDLLTILGLTILIASFGSLFPRGQQSPLLVAIIAANIVIWPVALLVVNSLTDSFQMIQGLALVSLVIVGAVITYPDRLVEKVSRSVSSKGRDATQLTIFLMGLLLAVTPLHGRAPVNFYQDFDEIEAVIFDADRVTLQWLTPNLVTSPEPTISGSILRADFSNRSGTEESFLSLMRDAIHRTLRENNLELDEAVIYLSTEDFSVLESFSEGSFDWNYGLLVTAVTRVPLIYGVNANADETFGNAAYDSATWQRPLASMGIEDLCSFNRPVLVASDFVNHKYSILCQ